MLRYIGLALALIAAGCITAPDYTPIVRYTVEPRFEVPQAQPVDKSLGIRPIEAARPYKQPITYRASDFELRNYEYAEWAESPRDMVTRALTDAIIATQRFKDIGNAADLNAPDLILTGQLRKFDEDRTTAPWTAACEVRLELRDTFSSEAVWAATLRATEPMERNDVSTLPLAMSRAISIIVEQAAREIAER